MSEPPQEGRPAHWPAGVAEINIGQIGLLGVDKDNRLYWDGKPVEVKQRLSLSWWQGFGSVLLVVFSVVGGLGAAAQGWAAAHQWSCQIRWTQWACPPEAVPPAPGLTLMVVDAPNQTPIPGLRWVAPQTKFGVPDGGIR